MDMFMGGGVLGIVAFTGGGLLNYYLVIKGLNGNSNGKAASVKAQLLMEQHVEALQAVCGSVEKTRERAAEDTKEICDLLAAQSTAIALLHQAQQAHAEHNQAAWRDTFALLRDK